MNDFLPNIIRADATNTEYAIKAAKEDGHQVIGASHLVVKNNEIVGYVGIATIPTLHLWMHTQKTKSRDSAAVLNFVENTLADRILPNGKGVYLLPVQNTSPYYPILERIGFTKTTYTDVYIKSL